MLPAAVFVWLQPFCCRAEISTTQYIFKQNCVSCICSAPCQDSFFPPSFSLMEPLVLAQELGLGKGKLLGLCWGLGMDSMQRSPLFPRSQLKSVLAHSLHLRLLHCLLGAECGAATLKGGQ